MFVNVTKDNVIVDEDSFETHQGEYNVTTCYFTFSEEFDSLIKMACFTINSTNETYKIDIVDNECSIPAEVLEKEFETITLGVYGYAVDQSDNLELRYSPTPFEFYVERGSYKEGGETPEIITPTQYELYSQKLQEGLNEIDEAVQEANNLDLDAEKVEHTTTVTITKKDGTTKEVDILDGILAIEYDKTLTQDNKTPNSKTIGDKINNTIISKNLFNKNDVIDNHYYGADGSLVENNDFIISNIIEFKNGERLISQYGVLYTANIYQIVKVDAFGNFISRINQYSQAYWVADEDCYIRCVYRKTSSLPDYKTNLMISKKLPNLTYKPYLYELKEDNSEIDQISEYINLFDINNSDIAGASLTANGVPTNVAHYFICNIMKCSGGDIFYLKYHNPNITNIKIANVVKYDTNFNLIERVNVNDVTYTAAHNGYLIFTCANPSDSDLNYLTVSKNIQLGEYVPHKRTIISTTNDDVNIKKVDNNNFIITFGDFKIKLFKTDDNSTNSHNWNITTLTDYFGNVLVPEGTDIIGPVKINENTDFIGGVHGDETTNEIRVVIGSHTYNMNEITDLSANSITITMRSTCYDQIVGDKAFDRYVTLYFTKNKIHVVNSFRASKNLTLVRATNGGLIGCRNNIINSIMFNNSFFGIPPTSAVNNQSRYNTSATINTIYGSITVNNIKGYDYENYEGQLTVMTSETPMRCKVYLSTYKNGSYAISKNDIISGEFEYILS